MADGVARVPPSTSRTRASVNTRSPLLLPVPEDRLQDTHLDDVFSLDTNYRPFNDEPDSYDPDLGSSDDEDAPEETAESVHVEGVPRSSQRFDAKCVIHCRSSEHFRRSSHRRYGSPAFVKQLLIMLRDELALPGWADLPIESNVDRLTIFKVSGALTNAVFFVSCPQIEGISPPTVLVRIYGPSSDSLLSRKLELHVLHTLSSEYEFGPHVLGTFENGRVEEYFDSKALNKSQMRDPRMSCWIARRMKELHGVNIEAMRLPDADTSDHPLQRPGLGARNASNVSLLSTSSSSSVFSFGSSVSNSSSLASRSRAPSLAPSPATAPRMGSTPNNTTGGSGGFRAGLAEVAASVKRRASKSSLRRTFRSRSKSREAPTVWLNITSWTREAARVLRLVEATPPSSVSVKGGNGLRPTHPLSSPEAFAAYRLELDLRRFEAEVKRYRAWTSAWEKEHGKAKRVFAHNDAQYGNILVRVTTVEDPVADVDRAMDDVGIAKPHELLIVVDFEYAAMNPRGFDLANHFIEWQADYHSAESHALTGAYPSLAERRRFYRSYIGSDGGDDTAAGRSVPEEEEDSRVLRLDEEVRVWTAASHAMWAVWALVQARDQVEARMEAWATHTTPKRIIGTEQIGGAAAKGERPALERGKSGEGEPGDAEFDYLLYAKGRIEAFRRELIALQI